jgi:hypothetical protein
MSPFLATEAPTMFPRIFILGDPGSGKTHLIGLIHEMTKKFGNTNGVFLGDFDKGYPTLTGQGFDVNVELYVDSDPNTPTAWKRFCDDTELIYKNGNKENYSFIAGDSFTTIQNAVFNDIIIQMGNRVIKNRVKYRNVNMTDRADYGAFERAMSNDFFIEYIKLCDKMGAILTVHTEYMPAEDGQPPKIMPKVKGNAIGGSTIMLYFNETILTKVVGTGSMAQRKIQTTKDAFVDLKSQVPGMPSELSFEEYVLRMGIHYNFLKGENIKKYALEKKIDLTKLSNFKIPQV